MEAGDRILYESRDENRHFQKELECLNEKLRKTLEANKDLTSKLEAAQLNSINLERQILDLNLLQSNHRDANRQEVLLNDIKVRDQWTQMYHNISLYVKQLMNWNFRLGMRMTCAFWEMNWNVSEQILIKRMKAVGVWKRSFETWQRCTSEP